MDSLLPRTQYVVVLLFEPLPVGAGFERSRWPAHVTLASNFRVDLTPDELVSAVSAICAEEGSMVVRFGAEDWFGRDRSVPVRLVESERVRDVHQRLADVLAPMPGYAAADPDYWRQGYRPHLTLTEAAHAREGEVAELTHGAVAELVGKRARVIGAFRLGGNR